MPQSGSVGHYWARCFRKASEVFKAVGLANIRHWSAKKSKVMAASHFVSPDVGIPLECHGQVDRDYEGGSSAESVPFEP